MNNPQSPFTVKRKPVPSSERLPTLDITSPTPPTKETAYLPPEKPLPYPPQQEYETFENSAIEGPQQPITSTTSQIATGSSPKRPPLRYSNTPIKLRRPSSSPKRRVSWSDKTPEERRRPSLSRSDTYSHSMPPSDTENPDLRRKASGGKLQKSPKLKPTAMPDDSAKPSKEKKSKFRLSNPFHSKDSKEEKEKEKERGQISTSTTAGNQNTLKPQDRDSAYGGSEPSGTDTYTQGTNSLTGSDNSQNRASFQPSTISYQDSRDHLRPSNVASSTQNPVTRESHYDNSTGTTVTTVTTTTTTTTTVTGPGGTHTIQYPKNEGPDSRNATYTEGDGRTGDIYRQPSPNPQQQQHSDLRPVRSREENRPTDGPPIPSKSMMREPGNRSPIRPTFAPGPQQEERNQYPQRQTYEAAPSGAAPSNASYGPPQQQTYSAYNPDDPSLAPAPLNTSSKNYSPSSSHHPQGSGVPPIPPIPENYQTYQDSPTRQNFSYPGRIPPTGQNAVVGTDQEGRPLRSTGATLQNLKAAAAGLHGAGETLRGTFNQSIDRRWDSKNTALQSKNEEVIARGRQEIENARFGESFHHRERQGRLSNILTKVEQMSQGRHPEQQGERSPGGRLRVVNE
ncbi:hypothetical protein M501DRAFT_1056415 [Patellaria atrata CBS 101060]|uniref:Uncharacterized protein n=1 Tax=Patellaria atrata CBS 101060 TaxID=1346257 RepID=A0A9P4SCA5_9PEZI|nr:hypothetical protein M501DRAFT_1056415 [Patellaria atrata CBS 101060]